jgi:TolB-like protein
MIRTIHGKGFRFIGNVRASNTNADVVPAEKVGCQPSIAVLPFDCDDPGLAIISEALPHELIVGLSRLRSLKVIARGSSFRVRGWPGGLQQVAAALGVQFCMTGAVHQAGSRVTIAVELVDARFDRVVWAELYEGRIDRLHEVREQILAQVIASLELQISLYEAELARLKDPDGLSAWSCYHLGLQHLFRFNRADNARALGYFDQAAGLEPAFTRAHAGVSFARFQNAFMRYTDNFDDDVRLAREAAERAIELDEQDPAANLMLGRSFWLEGNVESSVPWLERATALSPNYAQAIYSRAWTQMILCEGEAGQQNARAALSLSPIDPLRYAMLAIDGFTQTLLGDQKAGALLVDRAAREPRAHVMIAVMAAICHVWAGDRDRIKYWTREIKLRRPDLTKEVFLASFPYSDGPVRERVNTALNTISL